LLAKLEAYRTEAEDCALISKQAVDMKKKAYFAKLALQFKTIARDVEAHIVVTLREDRKRKSLS
jgi:hypothetical protein